MTPNTPTPSATAPDGQSHTPTPYYVGAQNDAIYIIAGKPPAKSNDYPDHDAARTAVAKVYDANDAAHIVHCVNTHSQLLAQNAALLAQREELLGLICEAVAFGDIEFDTWRGFVQRCEEAIANASKVSP